MSTRSVKRRLKSGAAPPKRPRKLKKRIVRKPRKERKRGTERKRRIAPTLTRIPKDPRFRRVKTVVRRRYRVIYVGVSPEGQRVMVKVNTNIPEARRERDVMKAYGRNVHLVRLLKYYERGGKAFIVMEWIPGKTLSNLILRHGAFPPETAVKIALKTLRGLDYLHRQGYVHGDLHAGNLIVRRLEAPKIKIIDMQMAVRKREDAKARARRKLLNPPAQFAPESPKIWIDDSYDIYGVGFMMACMLRGTLLRQRLTRFDYDSEAAPLWRVIKKAVDPNPADRYRSARDMADAIRSAVRRMRATSR